MSISSEITRISGNVSDALDAIEAKGVQIPTGANSDDLATLIASIPTGGSGVTVVETPDTHGGTIVTITGEEISLQAKTVNPSTSQIIVQPDSGYTALSQVTVNPFNYNWMGGTPEFVSNIYPTKTYTLAETNFDTWTPVTTATDMVASVTLTSKYSADFEHYEYLIRWRYCFDPVYDTGYTNVARIKREFGSQWQSLHRRPYGVSNFATLTDSYNYCATVVSAPIYVLYFNDKGSDTWTTNTTYGFYPSLTAATFSSTTSLTPQVTFKTPKIQARCSSTYLSTANASKLNKTESTLKLRGDLYRFKFGDGWTHSMYRDAVELYSNPL